MWAGHPWVFAQGIERRHGRVDHGAEVEVLDAKGHVLGRGLYSENSAIAVRLFTRDSEARLSQSFVEARLRSALARRKSFGLPSETTTGFRAFHAEGDELPGLIVDVFGDTCVVQLGTAGMQKRRGAVLDAIRAVLAPRSILDRTTEAQARAERFAPTEGEVIGESLDALNFRERGFEFTLPLELAQKTGFYFDQRPLRDRIEALAHGRAVVDAYSYVGAVGLAAARGGATRVLCLDSSAPALDVGRRLAERASANVEWQKGDAVASLEALEPEWDLVVADPPKLAKSRSGRDRALKAMRRVAHAAVRATRPGGLVSLSSCSAAIGASELARSLALGARDAGRSAFVLERVFQGPDHPVPAAFPEGLYLSTLIAEVP